QAARKLGAAPGVPEGVLSVEATLPNARAGRPLLLAGLAVAAVVGLILALDQASPPSRPPPPPTVPPPHPRAAAPPRPDRAPPDHSPPVRPAPAGSGARVYRAPDEPTVKHLLDWLGENQDAQRLELHLAGALDLSAREGGGGLVVKARHVTIKAKDPRHPPTLRFSYDAGAARGPRVALTPRAGESLVEGVRFVIDVHESAETEMIGLLLLGGQKHQVERCEFLQARPSFKEGSARLASVVAEADRSRPELTLRGCCFLGFGRLTE